MITPLRKKELKELEHKLGTTFLNENLLNQALTHSSHAHEHKSELDNERLEFLGDAVLKLVVSEHLFNKFPSHNEGELTKIRAFVVSDVTFAEVAQKLKLGEYLLLGKNERLSGGTKRKSNLANALEAVIGAVYLDQGIGKARDMILELLRSEIERISRAGFIVDYKSAVQEFVQKKAWGLPFYKVIREMGPRHKRVFLIEVRVRGKVYGRGKGYAKKEAEQEAAQEALAKLKAEPAVKERGIKAISELIVKARKKLRII